VVDGLETAGLQPHGFLLDDLGAPPAGSGTVVFTTSVISLSGQSTPVALEQ